MAENRVRKAFRTTKLKITKDTIPSSEQRDALEGLYMNLEASKTDAVAFERTATIATARARSKQASAVQAEVEFLIKASDNFPQVAGERMWIVYRDTDGTICLEGFTERLIRNNLRAQQEMLGSQLENNGGSDIDRNGLYETEDGDAENDLGPSSPDPDAN